MDIAAFSRPERLGNSSSSQVVRSDEQLKYLGLKHLVPEGYEGNKRAAPWRNTTQAMCGGYLDESSQKKSLALCCNWVLNIRAPAAVESDTQGTSHERYQWHCYRFIGSRGCKCACDDHQHFDRRGVRHQYLLDGAVHGGRANTRGIFRGGGCAELR